MCGGAGGAGQMRQGLAGEGPGKTAGLLEGHLEPRAEKGRLEGTLHPGLWREGAKGQGTGGRGP